MITWLTCPSRPVEVSIHFTEENSQHLHTLVEARSEYQNGPIYPKTAVWADLDAGRLGIIDRQEEFACAIPNIRGFEIEFCRPAKGHGYISLAALNLIDGRSIYVAASSHYDEHILSWFESLGRALTQLCSLKLEHKDNGYDA